MRRSATVKFPNSVQLFKFCHKVMVDQRGGKVHDQEVGAILNFNPSDCSHWKRGEKHVKSVFALAKLAEVLKIDTALVHDVASGFTGLDEAFFEYQEAKKFDGIIKILNNLGPEKVANVRTRIEGFVAKVHEQADFSAAPLYLPEVMRFFPFVTTQAAEMMDKLSRILRVKPGQYSIQYKKGDLSAQTRLAIAKDLARILFEGERHQYPELGQLEPELLEYEKLIFAASLLIPRKLLVNAVADLDSRANVVAELGASFWVPKAMVSFQLQSILRAPQKVQGNNAQKPSMKTIYS